MRGGTLSEWYQGEGTEDSLEGGELHVEEELQTDGSALPAVGPCWRSE